MLPRSIATGLVLLMAASVVLAQDATPPATGKRPTPVAGPPDVEMKVTKDVPFASVERVHPRLLSLDIYAPPAGEKHPVVVMYHGGGWRRGDKSGRTAATKARHFVGEGYVFISANYRLSPKVMHPVHVSDVAKSLAWVHDHIGEYGGDPGRIFIMGHSAGGHLVALVATDGRYLEAEEKSLSILSGVVSLDSAAFDLTRIVEEFAGVHAESLYEEAFGKDRKLWKDASPLTHVAEGKSIPPFLIFYTGRRIAAATLSKAMVDALGAAGTPAKAIHAADRDHGGMNKCIGVAGDPYTKMVMDFFAAPAKVAEMKVEKETGRSAEFVERHFRSLDKNADGELTPDEVPWPRLFPRMDANGDGVVTLEEAKAALLGTR